MKGTWKNLAMASFVLAASSSSVFAEAMECNRENMDRQIEVSADLIITYMENSPDEYEVRRDIESLMQAYENADGYVDTTNEFGKLIDDPNRQPSQLVCDQVEDVYEIYQQYIKSESQIRDVERLFEGDS
ncbi:hypothetical protein [Salinicola avicenniae]|uniref:hypothetical protein n=1 Tax=Salinicola avicenniae TaxID=2916836 RepID=UPI0020747DE3|nr:MULTISPECIES: hypothetical protein [unclassified Salinicola]